MIAIIRKYIAAKMNRLLFLNRAHRELCELAFDCTTPERFEAGFHDIRRCVRYRYARVRAGHNLSEQKILLANDINGLYINTAQAARKRLGAL